MDWIKIEEKNPPFKEPVLVCNSEEIGIARLSLKTISCSGESYEFQVGLSGYDMILFDPTHWMPLPKLPNKETPSKSACGRRR